MRWQCVCLFEVVNFATLRRNVGRGRAAQLIVDVEARIGQCLGGTSPTVPMQSAMELWFERSTLAEVKSELDELERQLAAPFELDNAWHSIEIAMGAATAPIAITDEVRFIEEAESALEVSKTEQRNVLHDLSAGTAAFDRIALTREMPLAIANGEMFVQYQPKVHVRKQQIKSAEALIRWQHPVRGLILPGDFIMLAEEARQISALTLWTLDRVIEDQAIMSADGHDITVFINISGQLLGDSAFVADVCARILRCDSKIGFEITETSVIRDPTCAIANLKIFADAGIVIAIDDYGAGLSSLAYLKKLPASELKIDKMFVLQLTSSNRDPLIVRSTIDLAHALDMEVTAEGVETPAALALLSVMGCDMVQGYLISRPISIAEFRQFLRDEIDHNTDQIRKAQFYQPAHFWKSA